ncbi:MAG: hypothetical protein PHQ52_02690 [Candidatus Omnitrophica bacterium]|nr:hypothetical protein [Candidatus Omnitrophota bacterium]
MNINIKDLKSITKNPIQMAYMVIVSGLLLLGYLLIWKVDVSRINSLKAENIRILSNIGKVQEISKYRNSLKEFNQNSVVAKGANWLVEKITTLAKENKVTLGYVEPLDSFEENDYAVQKVLVEGTGLYFDIVKFLLMLENDEKYTYIEELQLDAQSRVDDKSISRTAGKIGDQSLVSKDGQVISDRQGALKMVVINLSKR